MARPSGSKRRSEDLALAKLQTKTARSMAAWDKLPWVTGPLAAFGIAAVVAGEATAIDLNVVANLGLTIAVPAAIVKYLWDRSQKRRQRKRLDELEKENQALREELAETRGRLDELRVRPPDARRRP
jgi:Flp pilus assembly protein TadB